MSNIVLCAAASAALACATADAAAIPPAAVSALPDVGDAQACRPATPVGLAGARDALVPPSEHLRLIHVCPQPPPGDQPPAL